MGRRAGFTIVELLIVVVVIAILAAITIVAYNGVQDRARLTVLKSDLSNAAKKMESTRLLDAGENYPATLSAAGIVPSTGIDLQLTANNSVSPKTFCITAVDTRKPGVAYRIASGTGIESGQCAGHTTNPGFTNLVSNPGFETVGATVVGRTNIFTNPRQVASGSMGAGLSPVTGLSGFGGFTTGSTGVGDGAWKSFYVHSAMPFTGTATPVAVRFWAKASESGWLIQNLSSNITLSTWSANLTRLDTGQSVSDLIGDNVAREYLLTFTVPASQTTAWSFGFKNNSGVSATKSLTITGFQGEIGVSAGSYFDGQSAAVDGLTYAWTGTPDSSTSVEQGTSPSGYGATRVASIATTGWSALGSRSLMQVPTNATQNDSYTDLSGSVLSMSSLKPSTQYTFMATARLTEPLKGSLRSTSRSLFVHLNGTTLTLNGNYQAPNEAGTYDLRATFTTPSTLTGYNSIRLYHGGFAGSGNLWWDKIGIVEGDYTGSYFE